MLQGIIVIMLALSIWETNKSIRKLLERIERLENKNE